LEEKTKWAVCAMEYVLDMMVIQAIPDMR
jgi:hypothetical protein